MEMITTTVNAHRSISSIYRVSFAAVAKMLSRIFQFHAAFEMEPVIKVRYKLRWLLVLLSVAAAAGPHVSFSPSPPSTSVGLPPAQQCGLTVRRRVVFS